MCLRLLSARHTVFRFLPCGCCAPGSLTLVSFVFSYARGRYVLIGCLPCHVPLDRLLTRPDSFFVMLTISRSCLLLIFGYGDSS